jgi:hypothetical protein
MTGMDDEPLMRPRFRGTGGQAERKTPSQIEGDIAATRTELGEIIDALEHKLAPRRLLASGVDRFTETIRQNLRSQPMPLAVVGLGLGWLLMSHGSRPFPSRSAHDADQSDNPYAGKKAGAVMERARIALDGEPNRPRGSVMDARPLALGVLGLLAGAAVALMLPRSAGEERLIRSAGERLREETANLGRDAGERVADLAIDAAVETVRHAANDTGGV